MSIYDDLHGLPETVSGLDDAVKDVIGQLENIDLDGDKEDDVKVIKDIIETLEYVRRELY